MGWLWYDDQTVQPVWAAELEQRINKKLGKLMALVSVQSEDLDALDAALDAATTGISDKIQALIDAGTLPAADLQPLLDDVAALQSLAAPAPVDEPPAEPPVE